MKYLLGRKRSNRLLPLGVSIVFTIINLHTLNIGLLPADDHEIVMASGNAIGSWLHSEAFQPWLRWRPSYYTMRYLETMLWHNNAFAWHLTRLIGISSGIYLLCLSSIKIIGPATGSLLGIALVFSPVLNDFAQILGPAETYCFFGLSLWAFGCTGLLEWFGLLKNECFQARNKMSSGWHAFLVLIGSVIAAGSKENLVILMLPNLWMLYKSMSLQKSIITGRNTKIMLGIASSSMVPMAIFLANLYFNSSKDIYSKSLSPGIWEMIEYIVNSFSIGGLLVSCATIFTLGKSIVDRRLGRNDIILAFLLLMSIWSVYVNRQIIPFYSAHRYALLHQLGIYGMFFIVISNWSQDLTKWGDGLGKAGFSTILLAIIIPGINLMLHNNAASASKAAESSRWQIFTSSVANFHKKTKLPIVIVSTNWIKSYELSYSAARFLRFAFGVNPQHIHLSYVPDSDTRTRQKDEFQSRLESEILNPKTLESHLLSSPGGIVDLQKSPIFISAPKNMTGEIICADPINSQDEKARLLFAKKCAHLISF